MTSPMNSQIGFSGNSMDPIARILELAKQRLKADKVSYPVLANELGVSLPTVKRWMSGKVPVTFQQLSRISEIAEIDFWDLLLAARPKEAPAFRFTLAQEEFFSAHPHHYAFFEEFLRRGKSREQIQQDHGISAKSVNRYLRELERIGIAFRSRKGEWKTRAIGTLVWDDHGPMGRFFSARQIGTLAQRASREKLRQGKLWLNGWRLTEESFAEFCADMEVLREKYRQRSSQDARSAPARALSYTFVGIVDQWEDEIMRRIIEL